MSSWSSPLLSLFVLMFGLGMVEPIWANDRDAIRRWAQAVKKNPQKVIYRFNLAVAYHKKKKYNSAIKNYMWVVNKKSQLAPVCYYYMAKIYSRSGKIEWAKQTLGQIKNKKLPNTLKTRIENLKKQLQESSQVAAIDSRSVEDAQEKAPEKRLGVFVELAGGSNNNPSFASSFSSSEFQWASKAYVNYKASLGDSHQISTRYFFNSTSYGETSSSNFTYHLFSIPSAYYFAQSRVRLIPEISMDTFGGDAYSYNYGGTADYALQFSAMMISTSIQYLSLDVSDDENSFHNGSSVKVRSFVRTKWKSLDVTGGVTYSNYGYDDTDEVTSSYSGVLFDINLSYVVNAWDFSFYTYYEKRNFVTDSGGLDRVDNRQYSTISAGYSMNQWVRFFLSYFYRENASNDAESNYHQASYLVGLSSGY